jgi:hypothetical protein
MSNDLFAKLAEAGLEVKASAIVLTEDQKFEKLMHLELQLAEAKAVKDDAKAKRIRNAQRRIMGGPWRKAYAQYLANNS